MALDRPRTWLVAAILVSGATAALLLTAAGTGATSRACPPGAKVLAGVYHPSRLTVLAGCERVSGRVIKVRPLEEDGDVHLVLALTGGARKLLAPRNDAQGGLVVELMPRDGGHLPKPKVGDRLSLVGAWVDDTQHGWNEIHPVWMMRVNGGPGKVSGPQFGGSPAGARSKNARRLCRDETGHPCADYGPAAPEPRSSPPPPPSGGNCDPNYTGACVPPYPPDVDCADINGPVRVVGSDPHHLDGDGDGVACE